MADEVVTKRIASIGFGVVSPGMIKKIATINVVSPELYDADGYPVEKGLMDLGMGVIDPGLRCKVCGGRLRDCPGHFGYIQLAKPVIHVSFVGKLLDVLRGFCPHCGRILAIEAKAQEWKQDIDRIKKENNIDALRDLQKSIHNNLKKVKKCPYCNEKVIELKLEKPTTFYEGDVRIWPENIRERLEKIPDEDLAIVGFDAHGARPEWLILTMLLVPPITMRPSITLITGERSEDDLTHKLSDIVRVNQRLIENINAGAPEIIIEDLWDLLQYHVTTYFDNKVAQVPPARHKTNRPLKTLAQRLAGKEGRIRYNLAGKRVNFCARSVITPDPFMSIDEVGVPMVIASELTMPERATEWNLAWLKDFIKNGDVYPGAAYVITLDGKRKKITEDTKEQILTEIAPGWVVERHLLNGDVVLFNRQPSLHRLSIMGHRVKILGGKTLRIHPATTTPYNADFDGDEMNLHVPQTEEARSEAKNILAVGRQLVTPRYGLSIIGEREDTLVGLYVLTNKFKLNKTQAAEILIATGIDADLPEPVEKELWDGKQIASLALPSDLNYEHINDEGEVELSIKDGQIRKGVITNDFVGSEGGKLLHFIYKQYGPEKTRDVADRLNALGLAVVRLFPYTFSFSDLDLSKKAKEKITEHLQIAKREVRKILKQYRAGEIVSIPGKTMKETREAMILNALNKLRRPVGEIVSEEATEENNLVLMSKCDMASINNLAMISGFVGQQALRGKRVHLGYTGRTLPHFSVGDLSPKSRGFIEHGYGDGMDPIEMFMNSVVGRDSYMDTAMRTPKSGYMQRRLINALQDLHANYDGTVRDSGHKIVQFTFGGDNVDVSKSFGGTVTNVGTK
jgi:DNA-directed RNA polymerase subunit A'